MLQAHCDKTAADVSDKEAQLTSMQSKHDALIQKYQVAADQVRHQTSPEAWAAASVAYPSVDKTLLEGLCSPWLVFSSLRRGMELGKCKNEVL